MALVVEEVASTLRARAPIERDALAISRDLGDWEARRAPYRVRR